MCYFGTNNRLLIYALCVILPTGQWGTPHYSQPATEEWLHLTAIWGTWNTLNIENHVWGTWCVISGQIILSWYMHLVACQPTGQWGTPHYSQTATGEWMHLAALWGMWKTLNIENHLGGPRCVIFGHIIQSRSLSNRGGSQPASEERPLLRTGHWETAAVWGDKAHWTLKTMSVSGGDLMCLGTLCAVWKRHFKRVPSVLEWKVEV